MTDPNEPTPRLRILMHPAYGLNQTATLLADALSAHGGVSVVDFAWNRARHHDHDVLHIHWPESVVRSGAGRDRWKDYGRFVAMIVWHRVKRVPMVWTVHNARTHERGGWIERACLELWRRGVDARVHLYRAALGPRVSRKDVVIPRGDYRPLIDATLTSPLPTRPGDGSLLGIGIFRPYKNFDAFARSFAARPGDSFSRLSLVGSSWSAEYDARVRAAAAEDPSIRVDIRHLDDEEFIREILAHDAVVLPYRSLYNSGVALMAIELERPVIVTESPTMRELAAEVGHEWVGFIAPDPDAREWAAMREWVARPRRQPPDLSARDWGSIAEQHEALYRRLLAHRTA
jgi:beta-1,4-mannosyltransferase